MLHDTTTHLAAPVPPLLRELWRLLDAHRPAVRQGRCFDRLRALVVGSVLTVAHPTITSLVAALGLTDADWSAFYRLFSAGRLEYDPLTRCFLHETLPEVAPEGPYVAALDGTQFPRASQRMPGTAWLKAPRTPPFKPGIHRAQRYLHLAALLPRWRGYSRALPLRFVPAFPPKAVPGAAAPCTEWAAGLAQLTWLRDELDAAGREEQALLALAEGSFEVVDLWKAMPERVSVLARTACKRVLYALPQPTRIATAAMGSAHRGRKTGWRTRTAGSTRPSWYAGATSH